MTRFLYAWEWGAGAGHLSRFKPIADRLIKQRHSIVLAVRDLAMVRSIFRVDDYGRQLTVQQAPTVVSSDYAKIGYPTTFAELAFNLGYSSAERIYANLEAWRGLVQQVKPDSIICDFGLGAALVGSAMGIKTIRIGTGFECPPPFNPLARLRLPPPEDSEVATRTLQRVEQSVDQAMGKLIPGRNTSYREGVDNVPQFVATVPCFDHYEVAANSRRCIGVWPAASDGLRVDLDQDERHWCFAYLKRSPTARDLIGALLQHGIRIVLVGSVCGMIDQGQYSSDQLLLQPSMVDIAHLAPQVRFAVTNGNHGTTLDFVLRGIPVLAMPLWVEQRVTAGNLHRQGFGFDLQPNKMQQLSDALSLVLSDSASTKCKDLSCHTRKAGLFESTGPLESIVDQLD